MSAATLHRAAALMRERAWLADYLRFWPATSHDGMDETSWGELIAVEVPEEDRLTAHLATFADPAIAIGVADWLDVTATDVGTSTLAFHAALAVATAYLGES